MMKVITLLLLFVLCQQSWSRNICTRRHSTKHRVRECGHHWIGCWWYRYVWKTTYWTEDYCCPGWKSARYGNLDCSKPICNPPCYNGGTCYGPDQCYCLSGYRGRLCTTELCSHVRPCYPGICRRPNRCTCAEGFTDNGSHMSGQCVKMESANKPHITKSRTWLRHFDRATKTLKQELLADSTFLNATDIVWTNQRSFNHITFELESMYEAPSLPPEPEYVRSSKIGIIQNKIYLNVSKIPLGGIGSRVAADVKEFTCENGASTSTPILDVSNCTVTDKYFFTNLEDGDWMTLTFASTNGGFNKLVVLGTLTPYRTQTYRGVTTSSVMEFRFDFTEPYHCYQKSRTPACDVHGHITPLGVHPDITKAAITPHWEGWTDTLSGVYRYACEIFRLDPDYKGDLETARPLHPIHIIAVNHSSTIEYPTFIPPEPGMYAIVLEVNDRANMSTYARRLVLYDPVSSITLNTHPDNRLFASTASNKSSYLWQEGSGKVTVNFTWSNHFANTLHENGKFLNKVLPYPKQLDDHGIKGEGYKRIGTNLDDHEGRRTVNAIPNVHGIVRFEFVKGKDSHGGSTLNEVPKTGWNDIPNGPLREWTQIEEDIRDGDTVRLWVRAHDILGNSEIDNAVVHFDSSPPLLSDVEVIYNVENGTFLFSSRVQMDAEDVHSGIMEIRYQLKTADTDELMYEGSAKGNINMNRADCKLNRRECYCTNINCFYYHHEFDLDHCWIIVPATEVDTQEISLLIGAVNGAGSETRKKISIKDLKRLDGLGSYEGPNDLHINNIDPTSIRVNWIWDDNQRCSEMRSEVILVVFIARETPQRIHVHRDATFYDVTGLEPETNYNLNFTTKYGIFQTDDPQKLSFRTLTPQSNLGAGAIVGIFLVFLVVILVIVAVILFCLWRRGRLGGRMGRAVERTNSAFHDVRRRLTQRKSVDEHNKGIEDDIYLYGGMEFETRPQWQLCRDDVTFEELITSGKFATIYKAKVHLAHGQQNVVAKTLTEKATEDDHLLMKAKINFLGSQLESHPNIVNYIGAVLDDDGIGPFMLLEYCEHGNMREYLTRQRDDITEQIIDRMFQFAYDICKGMEFLASKNIVHRRLAARNVLLTSLNEAKITGFGPKARDDTDDDQAGKERIPMKWMAPECMKSTRDADEKSDVWSYGIVLWEIFSLGETPYPKLRSRDVASKVSRGIVNDKPELCDDTFYKIMSRCWKVKATDRPSFCEVRADLDPLFVTQAGDDCYYYYQGKS